MNVFFNTYFLFVFNRIYLYILEMTIGQRIKELRKELKISQKELGTLLNVAQQVVSYYENGDTIDASKLTIISERYNIDIKYFFEHKPLRKYQTAYLEPATLSHRTVPVGWDELLDDINQLDLEKIKIIESVLKALLKEFKCKQNT